MDKTFKPVVIIPFYNHGKTIGTVVERLAAYQVPIVIIDDGSDAAHANFIDELIVRYEEVKLLRHSVNRGKGAAVQSAVFYAQDAGYSHALQIDADLQHDISDVPRLISLAENHPESLILAYPIFGSEAPLVRVWGRKLTTTMVAIQTMSFKVRDALFGFRVYPLRATASLLREHQVSQRMAFDAEIVIRLVQRGLAVINIPSLVTYYEDGISHFRYFSDNVQMIRMHLAILFQLPAMLSRRSLKKKSYHGSINLN
jgi:glycosyltransferase involved in cell wall biosynthesis